MVAPHTNAVSRRSTSSEVASDSCVANGFMVDTSLLEKIAGDFFDTSRHFRRQKTWFLPPASSRSYARAALERAHAEAAMPPSTCRIAPLMNDASLLRR